MKIFIIGIICILIILFSFLAFSYPGANRVIIDYNSNVYLTSYNNDKEWNRITIITSYDNINREIAWDYTISDSKNCALDSLSLDPTGKKVVYISACMLNSLNPSGGVPKDFYRLTILDIKNKKEIVSFKHGFYYSFSPNGNEIAFAERVAGEEGTLPPHDYQGGAWFYNFNSKSKRHIDTGTVGVMDINWSSHDSNIYVTNNAEVYCYNPRTGKGKIVPYHGIYFSPDGKYYVQTGDEGGAWLYRTSDNKEMTDWEKLIRREAENYPNASFDFICWSHKLNMAIFSAGEDKVVIFDPGKAKIAGSFRSGLIGFNADGTKAAVHPLASDRRPQTDKVEILNLLDLIKK